MHGISQTRHLPTRCPLCKGAVIERTSSAAHSGFMWFHCLFCNHWWKFRTAETYVNPEGELTGEIFIVTKNGNTYRLESVVVHAIPEEDARKHVESKKGERELENQTLRRDIDGLLASLEITQAEEDRLWKTLQLDEKNVQKAAAWRVAYNKAKSLTKEVENLQLQQQHLTSAEYFFEELPSGIATTRTDVDGKFSLVIPRQGRFAIVARGPRETFRDTQPDWFVWVSLDGETSKRLVLTNDNVLAAGSSEESDRSTASPYLTME